jgi:hypothetical protein
MPDQQRWRLAFVTPVLEFYGFAQIRRFTHVVQGPCRYAGGYDIVPSQLPIAK